MQWVSLVVMYCIIDWFQDHRIEPCTKVVSENIAHFESIPSPFRIPKHMRPFLEDRCHDAFGHRWHIFVHHLGTLFSLSDRLLLSYLEFVVNIFSLEDFVVLNVWERLFLPFWMFGDDVLRWLMFDVWCSISYDLCFSIFDVVYILCLMWMNCCIFSP